MDISFNRLATDFAGPFTGCFAARKISCLVGASGSGKSTLLKCIADLIPHSGEVHWGDHVQNKSAPQWWRSRVRYIHTHTHWWYPDVRSHMPHVDDKILHQLGLSQKHLEMNCRKLSSGESKRLGLIRGIQDLPKVLMFDEPFANLDSDNKDQVVEFISHYQTSTQATMVIVSHDLIWAKKLNPIFIDLNDLKEELN